MKIPKWLIKPIIGVGMIAAGVLYLVPVLGISVHGNVLALIAIGSGVYILQDR